MVRRLGPGVLSGQWSDLLAALHGVAPPPLPTRVLRELGDPCFDAVDYVLAGAGLEGVETRCARVAAACGLDGDRLHAWSQVIAPFAAVAHLGDGGEEPVIDELLALAR
ncbi:hypothetical protein ACI2L4_16655 [Streptomyces sparsogenes]|uniref:hypothetical protein n=1 Tax=Streptomyces sparsogenes TaxID=67365 RepID=UPI0033D574B7